jgi:hypothetical protein
MIYEVRTRFDLEPDEGDDHGPEFIANVVANAIRRGLAAEALDTTQGVTISVQPRGAKLHAPARRGAGASTALAD